MWIDVDGDGVPDEILPAPEHDERGRPEWPTDPDVEVEDDDVYDGPPVPVDRPDPTGGAVTLHATVLAARSSDRRPIVPAWLRSRTERRQVSRWAVAHLAHAAAYHATRTPKYAARTVLRAPVGAYRTVRGAGRWVGNAEARPLIAAAVRKEDHAEYRNLVKIGGDRARRRGVIVLAAAVVALATGTALATLAPPWAAWAAAGALLLVLARIGSSADKPLLDIAVVVPRARKLTAAVVRDAIVATRLAKDPAEITFPVDIARDGPGWRAVVDLPRGVTAGDLVDRRPALASGLDLSLGQVWPEPVVGGSARRAVLWVGDEDLSQRKPVTWPLVRSGAVDLFQPFRFGSDTRGDPIAVLLMFTSVVIGAIPRMGKTFALRLLILAGALDPTAELHVYDLKGGADLLPLQPVCHRFGVGDEDETIAALLADLIALQRDMRRRYEVLRSLPTDVCPEGKVTRALADTKSLRLHPVVLAIDECHYGFDHAEHGKAIVDAVTDLVKRGPAAGISTMLATQRPDAKSIPPGIRDNAGMRLAMRVTSWQVSEMITGTGMVRSGVNAATLTRADKGVGYLVGASDDVEAQLVRGDLVDGAGAEITVARARAIREGAGGVTGQAAGEAGDKLAGSTLLDDILLVVPGDARVHSETVVERLRELRPEQYRQLDPAGLAVALRGFDVETGQLKIAGVNKRGLVVEHVRAAIASRDEQLAIEGKEGR